MTTMIEFHILQNFAPSNLNRDDTGAPKEAFFGGVRRARISSQCVKRAVRQHFSESVAVGNVEALDLGSRTKRLREELMASLTASGRSESDAEIRIAQALSAVKLKLADDGKTQYLLYLGRREIEGLATVIEKNWDKLGAPATAEGATNSAKRTKKQAAAEVDGGVREALEQVLNGGKAVDVALFGRMLADLPEKNQHAACQVAHAISTHAVEREFDFYTAVDDLKPEDSSGADMMGTIEFNSACFYRYAVIDFEKLIENLQGDSELALTGVRNFVRGFVVAEPTGKQNSFAAHNPPEFVALTIRKTGGPRSYANAFEQAVRQTASSGITRVSADALIAKAKALATAYGAEVDTVILDLTGTETDGFGRRVSTLDELVHEGVARLKAE